MAEQVALTSKEVRPLTADEARVVRETMLKGSAGLVSPALIASIEHLIVVGKCQCGCASVDFEKPLEEPDNRARPIANGVGETSAGGTVGVIVWGRPNAITGLEIFDLGGENDNRLLPQPDSIVPWALAPPVENAES